MLLDIVCNTLYNCFCLDKDLFCYVPCIVDDESDTATEGEEEIKAREMRKQEVCLRIPDISVATSDTGSDTEVTLCTTKSIESNNKHNECLRIDDSLQSNMTNMNIISMEKCCNGINTTSTTNETSIDFNNPDTSTSSYNFNDIPSSSLKNNCYVSLNDILMNEHNSNNSNNVSPISNNNCDQLLSIKESAQKLKNGSLDHRQNSTKKLLNQSTKKNYDCSSIINKNLEDYGDQQPNNTTNDFKFSCNKSDSKPVKLNNIVTTEPYPKYTPTVEKAIKKYENKQPKKDCIVM